MSKGYILSRLLGFNKRPVAPDVYCLGQHLRNESYFFTFEQ